MNGVFVFRAAGEEHSISCADLRAFAEHIDLERVCPGRYSHLLTLDIYMHFRHGTLSPEDVVREIVLLESNSDQSRTKEAAPFRRDPLVGLWHKHYFTAAYVAHNILNELRRDDRLGEILKNACGEPLGQPITQQMANEIIYSSTHGAFEERLDESRLTGEWIVYAPHENNNYYLSLGKHTEQGDDLLRRITGYCKADFPFLSVMSNNTQ